jgi:L-aminoadipate-semialdehyde dehydrogenase
LADAIPTHFIPLKKLPLNPNGKVDKPALPFPDIIEVTAAASQESLEMWNSLSDNQRLVATAWSDLIPGCNAKTIRLEDSFFDIGGHSILAQRMLIDMRKVHGVQVPMASLFRDPTLRGFSQEINRAKGICINGEGNGKVNGNSESEAIYAEDAEKLLSELPKSFPSASQLDGLRQLTVFLTGASGFLGAYLLRDLLSRRSPSVRVIAHVRAKTSEAAFKRLVNSCTAYGLWSASWTSRLSCVTGNLGEPRLGLDIQTWSMLSEEVDVVIHNGAQVHWVYPYSKLKVANVQGTVDALLLCSIGKPKQFAFVSSTSVLDSEHYVRLSEKSTAGGGTGVLEVDDLEGSRTGLGTGYGQSKWVGEYLVRAAGKRGLSGTIIRPGYILGDSGSGGKEESHE